MDFLPNSYPVHPDYAWNLDKLPFCVSSSWISSLIPTQYIQIMAYGRAAWSHSGKDTLMDVGSRLLNRLMEVF